MSYRGFLWVWGIISLRALWGRAPVAQGRGRCFCPPLSGQAHVATTLQGAPAGPSFALSPLSSCRARSVSGRGARPFSGGFPHDVTSTRVTSCLAPWRHTSPFRRPGPQASLDVPPPRGGRRRRPGSLPSPRGCPGGAVTRVGVGRAGRSRGGLGLGGSGGLQSSAEGFAWEISAPGAPPAGGCTPEL